MEFEISERAATIRMQVRAFMEEHVYPLEREWDGLVDGAGDRWEPQGVIETLKAKAREKGLWNLFLPGDAHGAGLSNLEYAPICEEAGRSPLAPEIFNCSAPDEVHLIPSISYFRDRLLIRTRSKAEKPRNYHPRRL